MKQTKTVLLSVVTLFCLSQSVRSQELLSSVPSTKEEFIASEKNVLATIDWLENTPLDQEPERRKQQNALLIAWLTKSPTVTIELYADLPVFNKKNPDLLIIFMGGWTRYALQNNYSTDPVKGTTAGLKSAIRVYKTGQCKKDKEMEKLVKLEEQGKLEDWVKQTTGK